MFPTPHQDLTPNTEAYERLPYLKPTGFREYDARWWFNGIGKEKAPELNLTGVQALGLVGVGAEVLRSRPGPHHERRSRNLLGLRGLTHGAHRHLPS